MRTNYLTRSRLANIKKHFVNYADYNWTQATEVEHKRLVQYYISKHLKHQHLNLGVVFTALVNYRTEIQMEELLGQTDDQS